MRNALSRREMHTSSVKSYQRRRADYLAFRALVENFGQFLPENLIA